MNQEATYDLRFDQCEAKPRFCEVVLSYGVMQVERLHRSHAGGFETNMTCVAGPDVVATKRGRMGVLFSVRKPYDQS